MGKKLRSSRLLKSHMHIAYALSAQVNQQWAVDANTVMAGSNGTHLSGYAMWASESEVQQSHVCRS